MSTPSPIKRNKNLVLLSRDHHDGLLIVWKLRQGIRYGVSNLRMSNFAVNAFAVDVEPHFREEETLLFVMLAANDTLRLQAEADHAAIQNKVAALQPVAEVTTLQLQEFASLLEAHIRFEERTLFPYLEKEIPPEELERIGIAIENDHLKKTPFTWQDEFWIKNKHADKNVAPFTTSQSK